MEAHYDHMLGQPAACGAHPQVQPADRGKQVGLLLAHPQFWKQLLHGSADDVSEALESHLSRYKQSVAQARSVHPEYFIDE